MKTEFYTHLNPCDSTLVEMAEVGRFATYKITVYGSEGPILHFHFETLDGKVKGCIRLDRAEYFNHGPYQDRLSSRDRKRMVDWLNSPHKHFGKVGYTNWQVICVYWDDNNHDNLFNADTPMPNYEELR